MIASLISRVAALLHLVTGLALLFAPDLLLPRLVPGFPPDGLWLGQLLAAALLALASLNWLSQASLLGGIYGRAVVASNATFHFVAATALLRSATSRDLPVGVIAIAVAVAALAVVYGWLLLRGPFARDLASYRGSHHAPR